MPLERAQGEVGEWNDDVEVLPHVRVVDPMMPLEEPERA